MKVHLEIQKTRVLGSSETAWLTTFLASSTVVLGSEETFRLQLEHLVRMGLASLREKGNRFP